ncbi:MAG TPA: GAF domain-containing protein [Mycobacteriales bacterium]|nr:GAF domain-containing protein [Mycobacteriales bacterium]
MDSVPLDESVHAALVRLTRQLTSRHDIDDLLSELFRCLRPLLAFTGGSIQLLDDEGFIQMAAADPVAPPHVMAHRVPLGGSVAGRVILTESAVYLPDISAGVPVAEDGATTPGVRSYLGVPLIADGHAIGLLQIDSVDVDAWTERDRAVLLCIAPIVAAAVQSARAHAREAAARQRASVVDARLDEVRRLVDIARSCAYRGEWIEVDRQLARIHAVLADRGALRLPRQHTTSPGESVALPETRVTT